LAYQIKVEKTGGKGRATSQNNYNKRGSNSDLGGHVKQSAQEVMLLTDIATKEKNLKQRDKLAEQKRINHGRAIAELYEDIEEA